MVKTRHTHFVDNNTEHWLNEKWRPMMGWMYMCICTFDFMIAPVLWSLLQAKNNGMITSQWQPLTLQGAGLFHLAMGAILGITAYGRTQEKLNNNTMIVPQGVLPYSPSNTQQSSNFSNQSTTSPVPAAITTGFAGKKGPIYPSDPVI
jgi:hypothetical protein